MTAYEQFELLKPYHPKIIKDGILNKARYTGLTVEVCGYTFNLYDGERAKLADNRLLVSPTEHEDWMCVVYLKKPFKEAFEGKIFSLAFHARCPVCDKVSITNMKSFVGWKKIIDKEYNFTEHHIYWKCSNCGKRYFYREIF